ncbi:MAG: glycine zipper family protein [Burkholderiales bacterium]
MSMADESHDVEVSYAPARHARMRSAQLAARAAGLVALLATTAAMAQQPIVYPARGQSAAVQSRDDNECRAWARQSTGIDPAALAQQPVAQETGPTTGGGERVRGAARGALGGAAIGAIAGDAGQGAGIGAVVGTMKGGRDARRNQAARNDQAYANRQESVNTYYRAYGACMEGRGYSIK